MVDTLCSKVSKDKVELYFNSLFPEEASLSQARVLLTTARSEVTAAAAVEGTDAASARRHWEASNAAASAAVKLLQDNTEVALAVKQHWAVASASVAAAGGAVDEVEEDASIYWAAATKAGAQANVVAAAHAVDASITEESSSLFDHEPDRSKVAHLVKKLDVDGNGEIDVGEVKILLSKLLGIPPSVIPDDHEEVLAFAGMDTEGMITKLQSMIPKEKVEQYFRATFPEDAKDEDAKVAAVQRAKAAADAAWKTANESFPEEDAGPSLLNPAPCKHKVAAIVDTLRKAGAATILDESRLLLCRLLGLSDAEVPEGHHEVPPLCSKYSPHPNPAANRAGG